MLGIAVLSSALIFSYRADITPQLQGLSGEVANAAADGAGPAIGIAASLGPRGADLAGAARDAFAAGFADALWVAAAVLVAAAVVCGALAPGRERP